MERTLTKSSFPTGLLKKNKDDFAYEADFSKTVENFATPGSKVINLYAVIDKRLKLILDTDGGTSLLTRHVKYGKGVDSDRYGIPLDPQKPGEEFVGYYDTKPNNPIPATSIGNPIDLRTWKAPDNESIKEITLYAGYKAAKGTYNVNFYLENLDGSGNSFYSFETSTVMHDRMVGENPNRVDFPKDRIPNFDIIYQLNENKSDNVHNITISHDGRTNVNVYYDRREYEVKFYRPNIPGEGFIGGPLRFKYGEKIPVDTIKDQYKNAGYNPDNLVFGIEEPYGSRNNKDYITGAPSIGYNGLTNMNIIAETRSQGKNFTILSILEKDKENFEQYTMGRVLTLEDYAKTNLTVPDNISFDVANFDEKTYFGNLNVQRVDFSYRWSPADHMYLTKVDILDFEGYTPIHPYGDEKGFPNSGIDNSGNYEDPPGNDPRRGAVRVGRRTNYTHRLRYIKDSKGNYFIPVYYTRDSYNVYFDYDIGTDAENWRSDPITYSEIIGNPKNLEPYGERLPDIGDTKIIGPYQYEFQGWYLERDGSGQEFNFNSPMPKHNLILFAKWKIKEPQVRFYRPFGIFKADGMPDYKSVTPERTVDAISFEKLGAEKYYTPSPPTYYTSSDFKGWAYYTKSHTTGETIRVNFDIDTIIDRDVDLYPIWSKVSSDIISGSGQLEALRLHYYDESGRNISANRYIHGSYAFTDEYNNDKFIGWEEVDKDMNPIPATDENGNLIRDKVDGSLVSKIYYPNEFIFMDKNRYLRPVLADTPPEIGKVNFNFNYTGSEGIYTETGPVGSGISRQGYPKRDGYAFMGWSEDINASSGIPSSEIKIEPGVTTYYAIWNKTMNEGWISLIFQDGKTPDRVESGQDGNIFTLPNPGTVSGYNFKGYNTEYDGSGNSYTTGQAINFKANTHQFFYGIWEKVDPGTGSITIVYQDGSRPDQKVVGVAGEKTTLPSPQRDGYEFKEYNKNPDGTGATLPEEIVFEKGIEKTVYVIWKKIGGGDSSGFIKLDFQDGTSPYILEEGKSGESLSLPNSKREGYNLKGWSENHLDQSPSLQPGGNVYFQGGTTKTYYAIWEELPNTGSITLVYNDGTNNEVTTSRPNTQVTLPELTRSDMIFKGWSMDLYGGEVIGPGTVLEIERGKDLYYYGIWEKSTGSVTFIFENGDQDQVYENKKDGEEVSLPNDPIKDGFQFQGWNTERDGNGEEIDGPVIVEKGVEKNIYAIWKEVTGKVIFNFQNGSQPLIDEGRNGTSIIVPDNPRRPGYSFLGWNRNPDGSGQPLDSRFDVYDKDKVQTFYAIWEEGESVYPSDPVEPVDPLDPIEKNPVVRVNLTDENGQVSITIVETRPDKNYVITDENDKVIAIVEGNGQDINIPNLTPSKEYIVTAIGKDEVQPEIWDTFEPGDKAHTIVRTKEDSFLIDSTTVRIDNTIPGQWYVLVGEDDNLYGPYQADGTRLDVRFLPRGTAFKVYRYDKENEVLSDYIGSVRTPPIMEELPKPWFPPYEPEYRPIPKKEIVVIVLESNGGTKYPDIELEKGKKLDLGKYRPERPNFIFEGWYKESDLINKVDTVTVNESMTLYAKWIPDSKPEILTDKHISFMVGKNDGLFHPRAELTKAEVITIFFRLLADDVRKANLTRENYFTDIPKGAWYEVAASTMAKLNIVKADENGKLNGNEPITRGDFAIIAAAFVNQEKDKGVFFQDIQGHRAQEAIDTISALGWIEGYLSEFRPDDTLTRAEGATIVNRMLGRFPKNHLSLLPDMVVFPDNMDISAWYYLTVQEATNSHAYEKDKDGIYEKWTSLLVNPNWLDYER